MRMKKLVICLMIVWVLSGCTQYETMPFELLESPGFQLNLGLIGVGIEVVNDVTQTTPHLELQLANETSYEIIYGESFAIEFYHEGNWFALPTDTEIFFVDIGYSFPAGESAIIRRNLSSIFSEGLSYPGRYRFRTTVGTLTRPAAVNQPHEIFAVFDVE